MAEFDLNVVASLLHTDTLSILAGEVGGLAGTQLQMDTKQCLVNIYGDFSFD